MNKSVTYTAICCLFFLTIGSSSVYSQKMLLIRIINPNRFPVSLHLRDINAFGYENWIQIAIIRPQSYVDIPNIPAGTFLGVDAKPEGISWPPFQVYLRSQYMPNYIYQVPFY